VDTETITAPVPISSEAERAAAETKLGELLHDMHTEGVKAMKIADRLGRSDLHLSVGQALLVLQDAQTLLTGEDGE
jgi:hypothetical protein